MEAAADDSVLPARATLPQVARACALVVCAVSATVLLGWVLGIRLMTSGLPSLTTMKVNTALCLGALAVSLLVTSRVAVRVAGVFVLVVAGLTLIEIVTGVGLGIDELLVADHTVKHGITPGQMAPATTVSLLVLAVSRLLLDLGRFRSA